MKVRCKKCGRGYEDNLPQHLHPLGFLPFMDFGECPKCDQLSAHGPVLEAHDDFVERIGLKI